MKKTYCFVLCCVIFCVVLGAVEAENTDSKWTIVSEQVEKNDIITVLSNTAGQNARVISSKKLTDSDAFALQNALQAISTIETLTFDNVAVRMEESGFKLVVQPTFLQYKDIDLLPYIPQGLAFQYKDALFYDIVLKVDSLMPKLTGVFIDGRGLLNTIYAAVCFPDMYMIDTNITSRIERLEYALMALSKKGLFSKPSAVSSEIVYGVLSLYNENPNITRQEAIKQLKAKNIAVTQADIDAVFLLYIDTSLIDKKN